MTVRLVSPKFDNAKHRQAQAVENMGSAEQGGFHMRLSSSTWRCAPGDRDKSPVSAASSETSDLRVGGRVVTRVTGFLAAALLCLSFLAFFPPDAAKSTEIPVPLDTIKLEVLGDTSLSVIWEKETGDISYKVQWKSGTQEYSSSRQKVLSADTLEAPGGLASTSITGLAPATTYTVRLKVEDHASLGVWSEEATATTTFGCDGQSTQGLKDDCAALVALYDSTGGANWTKKTKWKTSSPLGEWYGVWVKNGRVSDIVISGNNMSGTIPDLSKLTELRALRLHHSKKLSGTVPASLNSLAKLEYIYLSGNSLSGTVPAGLNPLTKLKSIWLDSNNLSGTIPDLSALTELETLDLGANNLSGTIPASLNSLTSLVSVFLSRNNLSGTIRYKKRSYPAFYLISRQQSERNHSRPERLNSLTDKPASAQKQGLKRNHSRPERQYQP